jgi:8-oxo-dGTP pyrophosphatase MutT (NUDIX family)
MKTPQHWEVVETERLQECKVFAVSRSMARSPLTGEVHPFFGIEAGEWVNVVPITSGDELVMVRQYRHGSREITLEIPGGIVDPGETPAQAAARELLEETGYRAERVEPIGSVNPNPALFGNRCHTFLAPEVVPVAPIRNTQLEETSVELVPVAEIPDQLRQGKIDHALVVAALYWYVLHGQGRRAGGEPGAQ